jgi:hypothetical protein
MRNIFTLFGDKAKTWLQAIPALVISERLAAIGRQLGLKNIIITDPNNILQGLQLYNKDNKDNKGRTHG